jgi:hypothetical protein
MGPMPGCARTASPTFSTGAVILAFCLIFSGKCESDQWAVVRKRV